VKVENSITIDNSTNAAVLQTYLTWLQVEMRNRLEQYFGTENKEPVAEMMPQVASFSARRVDITFRLTREAPV
jgi:hypothetical protein